ncbi:MAG: isoprenylcysteine carboxylmethyltransferase family protein [Anaerolineae bacterium]|nr:isoprenylcysteine carboxylmethyltransferase family protein [Anaerolineae bacterium]
MEWLPDMHFGWLNGWLMLAVFFLVFGLLLLIFPKDIVAKLYSATGWSQEQRILTASGKIFSVACVALVIFTPLKIGRGVFIVGGVVYLLGFAGMVVALFNFRNTPVDQPVTKGLYRISRNPQWVSLVVMFLGVCIAVGSWAAVALFVIAVAFYHFRILGEERACLSSYGESYRDFMERVPRYFLFF